MKLFSFLCFVIIFFFSQESFAAANKQGNLTELRVKNSQQAAQLVKARLGGKVLKVKKKQSKGQVSYRVKLVKENGRVLSVIVNAKTGKLTGN